MIFTFEICLSFKIGNVLRLFLLYLGPKRSTPKQEDNASIWMSLAFQANKPLERFALNLCNNCSAVL